MAEEIKLDISVQDMKVLDSLLKKLREQNPDLDIQLETVMDDSEEEQA